MFQLILVSELPKWAANSNDVKFYYYSMDLTIFDA